jgi:hypothetical protein|tara:strand:- start:605 stop:1105 length:501 start_codon:yes stop_codon:yes gene_type:complete
MNNFDLYRTVKTKEDLNLYLEMMGISPCEAFKLIHQQKFKHDKRKEWQLIKYKIYLEYRSKDLLPVMKKNVSNNIKFDKKTFLSKIPRAKSIKNAVYSESYEKAFKHYNPKMKFNVKRKRLEVKNLEKLIPCKSQNLLFDPSILSDVSSFSSMNRGRRMRWINFLR